MTKPVFRWVDVGPGAGEDLLALSPVLAETVAVTAAETGRPVALLRRQRPYVLLGPSDRRLPRFARGVEHLADRVGPVYMRIGGGSAVYLDESCLSFGVARPCRDLTRMERNFRELAEGVLRGLRAMGLSSARFGRAPGSYCEGPFDIVVGEASPRKLVGVAQAIRGGFALVSGMVLVSQDPDAATAVVQSFYAAAGDGRRLLPTAVTSLERELGRQVTVEEAARAMRAGFEEIWELEDEVLSDAERKLASSLVALRRLA